MGVIIERSYSVGVFKGVWLDPISDRRSWDTTTLKNFPINRNGIDQEVKLYCEMLVVGVVNEP